MPQRVKLQQRLPNHLLSKVVLSSPGGAPRSDDHLRLCSLNMGSMNFSFHPLARRYDTWKFDWERDYVANSDTYIFRNTFRDIETAAKGLADHDIKFEHECYDVGHLYNLRFCMDTGLFKAPIFIQFIFGILGGIGPEIDNLVFMKRTADRLFGDDYRWSVLGAGGAQMSVPRVRLEIQDTADISLVRYENEFPARTTVIRPPIP